MSRRKMKQSLEKEVELEMNEMQAEKEQQLTEVDFLDYLYRDDYERYVANDEKDKEEDDDFMADYNLFFPEFY